MHNLKAAALKYASMGFSVIPVGKDKKPITKWEPYQKQKADKEQINEWWTKHPEAGVAIVTGAISGLSVVDIDTAEGEALLKEKIGEVKCPTALTPGGGKHLYFQDFGASNKTGFIPGVDFRGEGGYIIAPPSPGPNGSDKMYAWVKGCRITEVLPPPPPPTLLSIKNNTYTYSYCERVDSTEQQIVTPKSQIVTSSHLTLDEPGRDNTLFHIGWGLRKGGMPEPEVEEIMGLIGSKLCSPAFPMKEIMEKVKSAFKRGERVDKSIAAEVEEWCKSQIGHFLVTECYKELEIVTRSHKHSAVMALKRLVEKGIIEKYGEKRGCYRLIDQDCLPIDYTDVSGEPLDVQFPFNLEKFIHIMPKNILVFAGSQDAGKTAFLLNFVRMNMEKHNIWYFSSEMGPMEFNSRLQQFDDVGMDEWRFHAVEREGNFQDVIKPDDINIIDYLEKTDNFYSVADDFKNIYKKLRKGIALVAIQKDPKATLGRGSSFSMEKARLYCTIDKEYPGQIIRIMKAKNWRDKFVKPSGHSLRFKIAQGCKFFPQGDWGKEEGDY